MKSYLKTLIITVFFLTAIVSSFVNCSESEEHKKNIRYMEENRKIEESTVLLNNSKGVLPLKNTAKLKIAAISIDSENHDLFNRMLERYTKISSFNLTPESLKKQKRKELKKKLKSFNTIIIHTTDISLSDEAVLQFLKEYQKSKQLVLCIAGEYGILKQLDDFRHPVLITGIKTEQSAAFPAQAVFGGVPLSAKLGADISSVYTADTGEPIIPVRLQYTVPEDAGINCTDLLPIDKIMEEAITGKMTPGAVVMIVKDGKVIFEKAYGHHTYECKSPVCTTDIYDLASITKAAASAIAVMRLYEQKKIDLDKPVSAYITETRKTDKKNITVRQLMQHQAGLASYMQFSKKLKSGDFKRKKSSAYSVTVADSFYLKKDYYKKTMWPAVLKSQLVNKGRYVYSDLGMFFIREISERVTGRSFDRYLCDNFYTPLAMQTACFNPWRNFSMERIAPTEIDSYFRNTTLQGYVHDQAAAMMGGIAGHAGLFSDANDLAILFQMLLNRGSYGGSEYFKGETVDLFTAKQSESNRRSLGFDGWDPDSKYGFPSPLSSKKIFGHTGFTGTCVWADPENKMIFIFLSNRTYPDTPNRLADNNIRSRILDVVYTAMGKS